MKTNSHNCVSDPQESNLRKEVPRRLGTTRRSLLQRALGFTGAAVATQLLGRTNVRADKDDDNGKHGKLKHGDAAILRFLAAAEILETDFWKQYTELAANNPPYHEALSNLDEDMDQYISDNTDDEVSHAEFINAYLVAHGATPVNLEPFRTLPSSPATGANQVGRLTNLTGLNVDTSWWLRYRSSGNPDFGDTFPQLIEINNRPTIPLQDNHTADEIQAIANSAAFHFAAIEQGGASLYATLLTKASHSDTIRIIAGIGGVEVNHFAVWHDKAGNAPAVSIPGLVFPDLESFDGDESKQKNLIFPEPCKFISADLPLCSVVRPTTKRNAGAMAATTALINSGLFKGQSAAFFSTLRTLAAAADHAQRNCDD